MIWENFKAKSYKMNLVKLKKNCIFLSSFFFCERQINSEVSYDLYKRDTVGKFRQENPDG